jgi:hypothetical protein
MQRRPPTWTNDKRIGRSLGVVRSGEWVAPPPIEAVSSDEIKRPDNLPSVRMDLDAAVDRMLVAYVSNLRTKPKQPAVVTDTQRAAYSAAAVMIIRARVSIEAYVTFAMRHMQELRGRTPYRNEVLSLKAVLSWLPQYRKRSGEVLKPPTYTSTSKRRLLWRDWIASARTLNRALSL